MCYLKTNPGRVWLRQKFGYKTFRLHWLLIIASYIGEAIRSILDVMEYTDEEKIPGIIPYIDFKKAFDSFEWNYLTKCLEIFNFGNDLIN